MDKYTVKPLKNNPEIFLDVPGSKSITNRALLLAAMGNTKCTLNGILFSDDSRAFLSCLVSLGFELAIDEPGKKVTITGTNGVIPKRKAVLNVGSAGTAARFLTVFLAFAGGDYDMNASEQMCRRPMEPLLTDLENCGVEIICKKEKGHFPFRLISKGINTDEISSDTDISSQFASALIMAAPLLKNGLLIRLGGSRTNGAYINITLKMMQQFNYGFVREKNTVKVFPANNTHVSPTDYSVEPDVSAACYFYAMSPVAGKTVLIKNVRFSSMQGDIRFIKALEKFGCTLEDTETGILVHPPKTNIYNGIDIDMKDFSDQTMTMAVVASFASSNTHIRNIEHIRFQESDRLLATINNLNNLGCKCRAIDNDTGLLIEPTPMHGSDIETYNDHRIAMAFSLIGLRIPGVNILNPLCCKKTFENYFNVLDSICDI
ncbi:MAG: 3-phosphoshikimate 1-carboxyvinyltransferase [Lachnospiraceae bacterium]|nr:3-phosphoshikimate 1-carboxyvinyltransferase [Lachnospiraceae bacterium]